MSGSRECVLGAACVYFVGRRVHKRTLSHKHLRSVVLSMIATFDLSGVRKQTSSHCVTVPLIVVSPTLAEVTSRGFKGTVLSSTLPPLFFPYSPFGRQTLRTRTFNSNLNIWGKLESNHTCQGKGTGTGNT